MVITLDRELEAALADAASKEGIAPEVLALNILRDRFLSRSPVQPRDEWERRLLQAASNCGVALSHVAVSSEELYD